MATIDPAAETARYLATMSPEQMERAISYTQGGHWMILWGFLVSLVVAWLIIRSGVLTTLRDKVRNPWLASLLVAGAYLVMSTILGLPWSIYANWHREKAYGLNNQTLPEWLSEAMIGNAIGVVAGAVFLMLLYFLIRAAKKTWWIWASGLTAAFIVLALVVSPIAIEPIFNKYTPAPDGPVRSAVVELAHKTGTPDDKIYIYDGTKQSDRYTANVSGLFGTARVALSDAMFKKNADMSEIRAVVGHEMGHYVRKHILWTTAVLCVLAILAFWLTDRLFPLFRRLLGADRVRGIDDPAGLPVLMVVLALLSTLATPIFATLTRTMEADADHFSMVHANEPDGMAKALIKTAEYRAPSPSAIEEFLFYDHPSVENRIRAAMEWKKAHPPAAPAQPVAPQPAPESASPASDT